MIYSIDIYKKLHSIPSPQKVRTLSKTSQLFSSSFCKIQISVVICLKPTKPMLFDSQRHILHYTRISSCFFISQILHRQNEKKSRKCKFFFSNFQLSITFVHIEKIARSFCMLFIMTSSIDILNGRCPRGVLKKFYIHISRQPFFFGVIFFWTEMDFWLETLIEAR